MLVLFDKNVPEPLRKFLVGHDVKTVKDMGWPPRIENGNLIKASEQAGFSVLVTADQNIRYQQNLKGRKLALVVLGSNIWNVVRAHVAPIALAVNSSCLAVMSVSECPFRQSFLGPATLYETPNIQG